MKQSACKSLRVFSALVVTFCVLVSSCSNFMDGSDLKNELDRKVKIAKSVCPEAKVEEPVFQDAGVAKNKKIIISFTKSMNTQTFWENLSITDSLGNNLKPNFLTPVWSNENKVVEIPANELNLIDLRGKKYLDIYVTLTKACEDMDALPIQKAIEHKYRINDETDNIPPELAFARGELPPAYVSKSEDELTTELYCGDYTYYTESDICKTNHIKDKVNFYVEGSDYGGGDVWAHFLIQRVYDVSGKALAEEAHSVTEKLEQINYDGNYFDTVCLKMDDPQFYMDGMYKITVSVCDASNIDSENTKVYYILRDTSLANSAGAQIWFMTPAFRQDEDPDDQDNNFDPFNKTIATKEKIEYYRNRLLFGSIIDDVYYISPFGTIKKKYQQDHNDFTYLFSWGTDLNKLSTPVMVKGITDTDTTHYDVYGLIGLVGSETAVFYYLPESFKEYCSSNEDSDIYLQVTVVDAVGNQSNILTLIPKLVEFYNYEKIDADDDNGTMTIRLNYSNKCLESSTDISGLVPIPDKNTEIKYRIFYAPIPEGTPESEYSKLLLQRNLMHALPENFTTNELANFNDKAELVLTKVNGAYPKYLVYIQQDLGLHSQINNIWAGESFGPLYEVIVDVNELSEGILTAPNVESLAAAKSTGDGSGLIQINGTITNYDQNTTYVPYVSTDGGTNWICYDTITSDDFSFSIMNPLKAPFASWKDNAGWKDDYFTAYSSLGEDPKYSTTVKIKIVAVKDNKTSASDVIEITVNNKDHDNLPPVQVPAIVSHDSLLSFDGRSFIYGGVDGLVKEDEGHLDKTFTYYYTPYNDAWGNNLSVLSEEEILALPNGTGTYATEVWVDTDENQNPTQAKYKIKPVVPVNGLSDGKYMFFARVSDTKGNSSVITLGKANINTFKNKLEVVYNPTDNSFYSSLAYNINEVFDRNMISIQKFSLHENDWVDQYGTYNELLECSQKIENSKAVRYLNTKTLSQSRPKKYDWNNGTGDWVELTDEDLELEKSQFYRITMQSFNQNLFDEATMTGVRLQYRTPYNANMEYDGMVNYFYLPKETEYDMYTEETVSNTVYYYVPGQDEKLTDIKNSFFKNTAAVSSNHKVLVNVISSLTDLGSNIDEWERRGKIVMSEVYEPGSAQENFSDRTAINAMAASDEIGLRYYVVVVHFANNTAAISNVYTMEGM
ncbi:MAG: hypothetical protein J5726_01115 [Treponema sp.]|nr:hypothetical protein [Treponema sp.]